MRVYPYSYTGNLEISRVITELFCRLAANPAVCAELLCHEELFATLMTPLERLRAQQASPQDTTPRAGARPAAREQRTRTSVAANERAESTSPSAERHLIALSEVLCAVASNSVGRRFFLRGTRILYSYKLSCLVSVLHFHTSIKF